MIQGKLVESVDGVQRYQFGSVATAAGGSTTPLITETLSPHMNKHGGSRMSLETAQPVNSGHSLKPVARHGTNSPPTPPLKTSSLERNYTNRIVQFKQPPDLNDANASYVDV